MKSVLLAKGIVLCALLSACATPLPPTQSARAPGLPDPGSDNEYQVKFPDPGHGSARYIGVTIGADIAADCGLVQTHFEFDSAEPLPQDQLVLKALAGCLNQPKFEKVHVALEGRADSRGSYPYNLALSHRRADRVKALLIEAGMSAGRISTSASGKRDAVGDDVVYSYGFDRRVDAVMLGVVHAPR